MDFALIAAVDDKNGIGKNGTLPWKLPKDLAYFNKVTIGKGKNAVIMGRGTWESIPEKHRPLAGRINIVMTKDADYPLPQGVHSASGIFDAIKIAEDMQREELFVIGGAQVFSTAIHNPTCQRLFITRVHGDFHCDTFFPPIPGRFRKTFTSSTYEENKIRFEFIRYENV